MFSVFFAFDQTKSIVNVVYFASSCIRTILCFNCFFISTTRNVDCWI